METRKEGQAFVKDGAQHVTVARVATEFSGEERPYGVGGRDFFRPRQTGLVQELVERERGQIGKEEKHATKLGAQLARPQIEPSYSRDGRRHGARRVGAFIVSPAG